MLTLVQAFVKRQTIASSYTFAFLGGEGTLSGPPFFALAVSSSDRKAAPFHPDGSEWNWPPVFACGIASVVVPIDRLPVRRTASGEPGARGTQTGRTRLFSCHFGLFLPPFGVISWAFYIAFREAGRAVIGPKWDEAERIRRGRSVFRFVGGATWNRLLDQGFGSKSSSTTGAGGRAAGGILAGRFQTRRITGSRDYGRNPPRWPGRAKKGPIPPWRACRTRGQLHPESEPASAMLGSVFLQCPGYRFLSESRKFRS
jgi:hypothetical protein